jgi:hypothetical protein
MESLQMSIPRQRIAVGNFLGGANLDRCALQELPRSIRPEELWKRLRLNGLQEDVPAVCFLMRGISDKK